MNTNGKKKRQYLIALETRHSIVALVAAILIFCCAMGAIFVKFDIWESIGEEYPLHYFTIRSNILTAMTAAFMVPFAVEGIHKKRFMLPRWIVLLQYLCALCVAITMISTLTFILPVWGIRAVTGTDFWLHIISPLSTLILFQCVESDVAFTKREMILVQIPYWMYMATYYVKVVIIGVERGGWDDFYMTMRFWPAWISIILMLALGYGVAFALRRIQNWRAAKTHEVLTRLWTEDTSNAELRIEAFGLGRYMGKHCEVTNLTIPVDIFLTMTENYDIKLDTLMTSYVKGAADAVLGKGED